MSVNQSHLGVVPVIVARGGTGVVTLTSGDVVVGQGASAFVTSSALTTVAVAGGTSATTLNVATGVAGNTVNIGTGINTSGQAVNISTGASAAASDVAILTGIGTAGAATLKMANNTRVNAIDLGNIAPAAARTTTICGGNSAQNDTLNIMSGAPSANTQTVNILSGVATGGTQAVNISSGASASTTTIGNTTGATTVNIKAGTGGIQHTGFITNVTNPCALAYLAATALNKTGNGAVYTLGTDALTVLFDKGTNLTTAGVFTAPATGVYRISAQIAVTGNTISTGFLLKLVVTGTSARVYEKIINRVAAATDLYISNDVIAPMTAADTFTVTIAVSGEGADTDDILGAATLTDTWMSATKVA